MITSLIDSSLRARAAVVLIVAALASLAALAVRELKLDALPDLSDNQVIVKAGFPGQPPQLVEDQVTYPLTAALLGVPGATAVRAFSMFGEAYVYVVLDEAEDAARVRSRVTERLAQLAPRLPAGATVELGPEASGVGWIYQYAVVAPRGGVAIERLRALQDFLIKPELQGVPGVAEVATFGGGARQLQVELDTDRMVALGLSAPQITEAVRAGNRASGGGAVEIGRQRLLISADARLASREDLLEVPVGVDANGAILRLRQVATVGFGPAPQQGVGDLDGRGDAVGGIVVMRKGENAHQTVGLLKQRIDALQASLPAGVSIRPTYDRARPIQASVRSLVLRLAEEALVVALVCGLFLGRLHSALVIILTLPIGLLVALAILQRQGVTANIMSLGGLAIAIGAMVDSAVVMVEALHRKLERSRDPGASHLSLVRESAREVGPPLFWSLLIITVSFLPVLALQGQEGKLFSPLALTKTWAMATAALLSVTLVPVLMSVFIRGRVPLERSNPLNRALMAAYRPLLAAALRRPVVVIAVTLLVGLSALYPLGRLGSEFMPPLDEGDLLYMPTTLPAISLDEAAEVLRITDGLLRAMPEVESVHGKAGRSDSATDPAPLSMLETVIRLKPREQWPENISTRELIRRMDERVRLAGLTNSWGYPIRTRIDMLATGVRTPLALRISGPELARIQELGARAEALLRGVPGVRTAFAERSGEGRFVEIALDRQRASLHGVRASEITELISGAVGGETIDTLSVGRERFPIVVRLARAERQSIDALGRLRLLTAAGSTVELAQVAQLRVVDGAMEIRSENARPVGYVLLDLADADVGGVLARARTALEGAGLHEPGYRLDWVGQYTRLQQATARLLAISAATLLTVVLILWWHFRDWRRVAIVLASLPFSVTGAAWFVWWLGYRWSFATAVGFLALAGIAAEFCVVMLLYLDHARSREAGRPATVGEVLRGALLRLRPKAMTVAVILGGLVPLMLSQGAGVDVLRPIAAPMIGGMLTAPLFSLLVVPSIYLLVFGRQAHGGARQALSSGGLAAADARADLQRT